MKKSLIAIVIAMLTLVGSSFAQDLDSTTIHGLVLVQAPTNAGEHNFTNRFAIAKLAGYRENVKIGFQYDLASNCVIQAEGILTYGNFKVSSGATFTAAGQITPAPEGLNTQWWYEVYNSYTFLGTGLGLNYTSGPLTAYAVRTDMFSAAALYKGFQVLYQENFGSTVAFESPWSTKVFNPFFGATFYHRGGENQYTAANFVQVNDDLRLYGVFDWGKVQEERLGIAYTVNANAKVLGYYNVEAEQTFVEGVFSF